MHKPKESAQKELNPIAGLRLEVYEDQLPSRGWVLHDPAWERGVAEAPSRAGSVCLVQSRVRHAGAMNCTPLLFGTALSSFLAPWSPALCACEYQGCG
uniref:Uncharacterized protein n=1 Tax=Xenopus tropicalis TaxID=8364 RepID=A0A803JJP1_XENTR